MIKARNYFLSALKYIFFIYISGAVTTEMRNTLNAVLENEQCFYKVSLHNSSLILSV